MSQVLSAGAELTRRVLRGVLGAIYLAAGLLHVAAPGPFVAIVPGWAPHPFAIVMATGVCEVLGAVALLFIPHLRRIAGVMLALYAVCVFPANINQAIHHIPLAGYTLGWAYNAPRLALQPVLVWAALFCCGATHWPFRAPRAEPQSQ